MSELSRYIKQEGIDQIEDAEQLRQAECEIVYNYCADRNFTLSDDDMQTIYSRGLEDYFDFWKENMSH